MKDQGTVNEPHTVESSTAPPRATYQDVLDAPPNVVAEIVDGKLYTNPRPAMPHAIASSRLGHVIGPPFDRGDGGPGGWWIVDEPELHFGKDILVPDIAGWRHERMPEHPTGAYCTLAPDWVCEVHSPSTRKLDLDSKRLVYAREEVSYLWLLDPDPRMLEAFVLRGGDWVLIDRLLYDASVSLPPFKAISFDLGYLFPPPVVHKQLPTKRTAESELT